MVKTTLLFLFILALVATLLFGINIGKKIARPDFSQSTANNQQLTITLTSSPPTFTPTPIATSSASKNKNQSLTTYSDKTCGFSFSTPFSFIKTQTVNQQSTIIADPNDPDQAIAATCSEEIPKPPLPNDKIESIFLDGESATLYHDSSAKDGSPRDEVIVKHPTKNLEIIIAGYGSLFQQAISSFRFL